MDSWTRRLVDLLTRGLFSTLKEPEPEKSAQKFEKYGMDFGPWRYGRLAYSLAGLADSTRGLDSWTRGLADS